METQIKEFGGEKYEYCLCPKCEVWIHKEDFKNGTHKNCQLNQKSLETRRLATKQVLEIINRL